MNRLLTLGIMTLMMVGLSGLRCKKQGSSQHQTMIDFVSSVPFPHDTMSSHVATIAAYPHPMGSPRQLEVLQYLRTEVEALGFPTYVDRFTANVPNPTAMDEAAGPAKLTISKVAQNLHAFWRRGHDCVIYFASHYDSKFFSSFVYRGANDSASSSAALLWLMTSIKSFPAAEALACDIAAVWFDGEESYLPEWTDGELLHPAKIQDNTYGSRHLADQMVACEGETKRHCLPIELGGQRMKALLLLDMIGSPNVRLSRDLNSHIRLRQRAKGLATQLGMDSIYSKRPPQTILDDHIPFAELGIPVINFIDFENLQYWHRPGDDPENVDSRSIEKVSRLALALALDLGTSGI